MVINLDQLLDQYSIELTDFFRTGHLDEDLCLSLMQTYPQPNIDVDPIVWATNQLISDFSF